MLQFDAGSPNLQIVLHSICWTYERSQLGSRRPTLPRYLLHLVPIIRLTEAIFRY